MWVPEVVVWVPKTVHSSLVIKWLQNFVSICMCHIFLGKGGTESSSKYSNLYLVSIGQKDNLGIADCFSAGEEYWSILTLIALFILVDRSWSKSGQIICRIIPSYRNLNLTSVTGTQRLILAQELTSIREQGKGRKQIISLLPQFAPEGLQNLA